MDWFLCDNGLCIQSEYGKMRTRTTPNTNTFYVVILIYEFLFTNYIYHGKLIKEDEQSHARSEEGRVSANWNQNC